MCYGRFYSQPGQELFLSSKTVNLVFGPGTVSSGVKWSGRDHLPPSTAEVGNAWSCPSTAPCIPSWHVQRHLYLNLHLRTYEYWSYETNIAFLCPSLYSETWPKRPCKGPQFFSVPFNTGTLVWGTVTPDNPDCNIFLVMTGFLYA